MTATAIVSGRNALTGQSTTSPSLLYTIGGECIEVRCQPLRPQVRERIHRWFWPFAARTGSNTTPLDVSLEISINTDVLHDPSHPVQLPDTATRSASRFTWQWGDGSEGWYDTAQGRGRFCAPIFSIQLFRYFLLHVMVAQLRDRHGLVLHGAAVVHNGAALLCLGASGAGKSTLVRDARPCEVLADDLAIVRWQEGTWWVYLSPWLTHTPWPSDGLTRLPLADGFILQRRPEEGRRLRMPPAVCAALLPCLVPVEDGVGRPHYDARQVATAAVLSVAVPWYTLSYVRSCGSPWRLLRSADPPAV